MARRTVPKKSKQVNNAVRGKLWSELKPGTKRKYKAAGVSPQKYNAARKLRGETRRTYLGLRPHQISGPSTQGSVERAYKRIRDVFGGSSTFEKFTSVRAWLKTLEKSHVRKIAEGTDAQIYSWAFNHDEEFSSEKASKRYGPRRDPAVPKSGVLSGGYLFYH